MSVRTSFVVLLGLAVAIASSTACIQKANLEWMDEVDALSSDEAAIDARNLEARVTDLFTVLEKDKISTYNTREKLRPFFQNEKDLTEFIAIYASTFRTLYFKSDRLRKFEILDVKLEQNGVIGLVRVDLTGRLYAFLPSQLKEVQKWQKSGGTWYLVPHHH